MEQKSIGRSKGKGYSVGVMQVHSTWFPTLKKEGFDIKRLKKDVCYNIEVGAWVLKYHIDEAGGNVWKGVGRYKAKDKFKQRMYIAKVKLALRRRG
jgi:soluble lytic murein transglycosylase-like protein